MAQGKGTSSVGAWLVVGCVAAIGFALFGSSKPETMTVESPAPAPVEAPASPPKQSFADSLLDMAPHDRFVLAQDFAAYGLKVPAQRREAYALALALLQRFPSADRNAGDAIGLERELVARQNLPAADKRRVTDHDLMVFAATVTASNPSPRAAAPKKGPPKAQPIEETSGAPGSANQALARWLVSEGAGGAQNAGTTPSPAPAGYVPAPAAAYDYVPTNPGGQVYVRPYSRADGTQVRGHYRSR